MTMLYVACKLRSGNQCVLPVPSMLCRHCLLRSLFSWATGNTDAASEIRMPPFASTLSSWLCCVLLNSLSRFRALSAKNCFHYFCFFSPLQLKGISEKQTSPFSLLQLDRLTCEATQCCLWLNVLSKLTESNHLLPKNTRVTSHPHLNVKRSTFVTNRLCLSVVSQCFTINPK